MIRLYDESTNYNEVWEIIQTSGKTFTMDLTLMGMNMLFDLDVNVVTINESTYKVDYPNKILSEI